MGSIQYFVGPVILVIYFNPNPALMPLQETISACKNAEKYAILTLIFEEKILGA